jgi:glycosyltransferase involved in cell wall biosynthesis
MKSLSVWVVQPGEPLPIDQPDLRLWRSGILARTLRDRGHRVVWWASAFRHGDHTFRVHEERFVEWEGITLALIQSPGYRRNVSLQRLRDHHVLGRNMARAAESRPRPDVIHCGYPTLETCEAMVDYAGRHRVPTVVDVRDMWPEAFLDVLPGPARVLAAPALRYLDRRAGRMLRKATAINGHTPGFRDYGVRKAGRAPGPLDRWFPFGYVETRPEPAGLAAAQGFWDAQGIRESADWLTICFFGSLNSERAEIDHRTLARAIRLLKARDVNVRAVYCGEGRVARALRVEFADLPGHVVVPGFMNGAQIWELMRRSDAGLLPYLPSRDFSDSLPNKSIEYLAGGLPVLTSLTRGYLFDRFSDAGCIVPYPAGEPEVLAGILETLTRDRVRLRDLSVNAAALFAREFRAEKVYGEMADYLEQLADPT